MNEEEFEKMEDEIQRRLAKLLLKSLTKMFCSKGYHLWFELGKLKLCCFCFKSEYIKEEKKNEKQKKKNVFKRILFK